MGDRICVRGCTIPGRHLTPHTPEDTCKGCLPVEATTGFLCDRCTRRLRYTLSEAPDLCVRIRSSIDPMRAQVFDREKLGGKPSSESRPPMSLEAIAAADEVLAILTYSAEEFGDEMDYRNRHTFDSQTDASATFHSANFPTSYLLEQFDGIVNDERVRVFAEAVLGPRPLVLEDGEWVEPWTIARALSRWPDHERDRMSSTACPNCAKRNVKVRAPRVFGQPTLLRCVDPVCGWEPAPW